MDLSQKEDDPLWSLKVVTLEQRSWLEVHLNNLSSLLSPPASDLWAQIYSDLEQLPGLSGIVFYQGTNAVDVSYDGDQIQEASWTSYRNFLRFLCKSNLPSLYIGKGVCLGTFWSLAKACQSCVWLTKEGVVGLPELQKFSIAPGEQLFGNEFLSARAQKKNKRFDYEGWRKKPILTVLEAESLGCLWILSGHFEASEKYISYWLCRSIMPWASGLDDLKRDLLKAKVSNVKEDTLYKAWSSLIRTEKWKQFSTRQGLVLPLFRPMRVLPKQPMVVGLDLDRGFPPAWFLHQLLQIQNLVLIPFGGEKKQLEERLSLMFKSLVERWDERASGVSYQQAWVERVFPQLKQEFSGTGVSLVFAWHEGFRLSLTDPFSGRNDSIFQLGGVTDSGHLPLMVGEWAGAWQGGSEGLESQILQAIFSKIYFFSKKIDGLTLLGFCREYLRQEFLNVCKQLETNPSRGFDQLQKYGWDVNVLEWLIPKSPNSAVARDNNPQGTTLAMNRKLLISMLRLAQKLVKEAFFSNFAQAKFYLGLAVGVPFDRQLPLWLEDSYGVRRSQTLGWL